MSFLHKHHIIPKHAGGSDDISNIIELSVEDHAEAHKLLFEKYGRWQDKIAWKTLEGQISIQDARYIIMTEHNPMKDPNVVSKMSGDNHWSKRPGNVHNWEYQNNPMKDPNVVSKMSGDNHWSKRPGNVHNSKINHPNKTPIEIEGIKYSSIKEAREVLNLSYHMIKKISKNCSQNTEV